MEKKTRIGAAKTLAGSSALREDKSTRKLEKLQFYLTSLRGNRIFCQGAFVELLFHQDECHRVRVDLFEALLEEDLVDGAVGDIGFTAGEYLETRVFFISLGGTLID